jgi:hypothetical protein
LILGAVLVTVGGLGVGRGYGGEPPRYSHSEYVEKYEGTKTCLECHKDEAESFFHSQHYQWQGDAPGIVNAKGRKLGKLNTMNDFCTNPLANWIGNALNADSVVVAQGCSKCHAGLGKKPEVTMTPEQLENIDCLICHATGYRRDLYKTETGGWEWKPILWNNPEGLTSVARRISRPQSVMCLRCHAGAGGGPNYKRGDIEYALTECDSTYDVHMGKNGRNMQCVDCHAGADHRVRGRGADLSGTDYPAKPLSCAASDCHGESPHKVPILDRHTKRVSCTVCHIREFAKTDSTDMRRDWSKPFHIVDGNKYSATITKQLNVTPVYAWYDGRTHLQMMGEPIERRSDGTVGIMTPVASHRDKSAKIYAFKLHRAVLPVLKGKDWVIPIAVEEFFGDGNIDKAVRGAAKVTYGLEDPEYRWVNTVRYMGIFHEVQPAARAVQCLECHSPGGRLDWKALGYKGDPLETTKRF